jgi:hypothetical protein
MDHFELHGYRQLSLELLELTLDDASDRNLDKAVARAMERTGTAESHEITEIKNLQLEARAWIAEEGRSTALKHVSFDDCILALGQFSNLKELRAMAMTQPQMLAAKLKEQRGIGKHYRMEAPLEGAEMMQKGVAADTFETQALLMGHHYAKSSGNLGDAALSASAALDGPHAARMGFSAGLA